MDQFGFGNPHFEILHTSMCLQSFTPLFSQKILYAFSLLTEESTRSHKYFMS